MTTIRVQPDRDRTTADPVWRGSVRQALLVCGVLSSLVYVAMDVLAGLRYEGYSFASQAISELGAIGAPTGSFLVPFGLAYDLLVMVFAVGVLREAAGTRRSRIVGALLLGYLIVASGLAWFPMHQRGTGTLAADAPHIISGAAVIVLNLAVVSVGAFALGKRFRLFSLATLVIVFVSGAMTFAFAAPLAAGEPTPGLGIIERISVYSFMLWVAVLALALLRRADS